MVKTPKDLIQRWQQFQNKLPRDCTKQLHNIGEIVSIGLNILGNETDFIEFDTIESKVYNVFRHPNGEISRPIRKGLFIHDPDDYLSKFSELIDNIDPESATIKYSNINEIIYTSVQTFSALIDLYSRSSRKIPGTFFEVMISALISATTGLKAGKQIPIPDSRIPIPDSKTKVTTDIVFEANGNYKSSLIVPTKTSTRERIVQPYAHQLILEKVFGQDKYKTILVSVGEVQLMKNKESKRIQETLVPGQIALYQKYVAQLSGLYYADLPEKYTVLPNLPAKTLNQLFNEDLPYLLGKIN